MIQTEEFDFSESEEQKDIADYNTYIELKKLNYSDSEIAKQFYITISELEELINKFK